MSRSMIKMLAADDSGVVRHLLREAAERTAVPVEIIEATDGRECVDCLAGSEIDLAFVDVYMPHISGLEALWRARSQGIRTFVTLMSSPGNKRFIELARKLSAYEFLFKPFNHKEVSDIIKSYARLSLPRRALVVDDSAAVRKLVHKVLAGSLFRLAVTEAADGQAALACCQTGNFDIVFLDCNMPGLNGLETLDRLVARAPHTKAVMISGAWNEQLEREALARGAIAFLHKPFYSGDVDRLLHDLYGICSPNLTSEGTSLTSQFEIAIVGRTISIAHKATGNVYEYLWFRDAPHLRLGQFRQNVSAGRFTRHVQIEAENAGIVELKRFKLINAARA
jgi:CheY-like chemotaxis protein